MASTGTAGCSGPAAPHRPRPRRDGCSGRSRRSPRATSPPASGPRPSRRTGSGGGEARCCPRTGRVDRRALRHRHAAARPPGARWHSVVAAHRRRCRADAGRHDPAPGQPTREGRRAGQRRDPPDRLRRAPDDARHRGPGRRRDSERRLDHRQAEGRPAGGRLPLTCRAPHHPRRPPRSPARTSRAPARQHRTEDRRGPRAALVRPRPRRRLGSG